MAYLLYGKIAKFVLISWLIYQVYQYYFCARYSQNIFGEAVLRLLACCTRGNCPLCSCLSYATAIHIAATERN